MYLGPGQHEATVGSFSAYVPLSIREPAQLTSPGTCKLSSRALTGLSSRYLDICRSTACTACETRYSNFWHGYQLSVLTAHRHGLKPLSFLLSLSLSLGCGSGGSALALALALSLALWRSLSGSLALSRALSGSLALYPLCSLCYALSVRRSRS